LGANFSQIKTWIDGDILTASDLNAEVQNILTNLTPAGIDDESATLAAMRATKDPYAASTAVLPTSLQEEIQELRYQIQQITGKTYWYEDAEASLTPTGGIILWPTDTAPSGFLLCSGQAVNRTTYATLFALIGTTYGVGDSSTTFNVPDLRGRFALGKDNMGGSSANRCTDAAADTIGSSAGAETHVHTTGNVTLSAAQSGLPAHTHTLYADGNSAGNSSGYVASSNSSYPKSYYPSTTANSAAAAAEAHNHGNTGSGATIGPYLTLSYIIKT
jgi:microcystin-dependent protein